MTTNNLQQSTDRAQRSSAIVSAREAAQKALFCAASRVLNYHTAQLDAKVARIAGREIDAGIAVERRDRH